MSVSRTLNLCSSRCFAETIRPTNNVNTSMLCLIICDLDRWHQNHSCLQPRKQPTSISPNELCRTVRTSTSWIATASYRGRKPRLKIHQKRVATTAVHPLRAVRRQRSRHRRTPKPHLVAVAAGVWEWPCRSRSTRDSCQPQNGEYVERGVSSML